MDRLVAEQQLDIDGELYANNGRTRLVMQGDGNVVVYRTDDNQARWSSDTGGKPVTHLVMQADGNLVAYAADATPYWDSETGGSPGAFATIQDDGNLVVYSATGQPLWASDTVQRYGPVTVPGFLPSTRAPLFGNGPWPPGTSFSVSIAGLFPVSLDVTHMGLCGGMSFLARDIYQSGAPQLRNRTASAIPAQLARHVLNRLIDSFGGSGVVSHWLSATQALDHDTLLGGPGLYRQTLRDLPAILDAIDHGEPCPIGLVLVQSYLPWAVFDNHVVLVWGYERHGDVMTLRTYDCNFPGRDDIVIELDISSPVPAKTITTNGTGPVRGFFPVPYSYVDPSPAYVDDASVALVTPPPAPLAPGSAVPVRLTATNTGSTTWTAGAGFRLGSQDPQDNTRWGLGRVELVQPRVDPGETATFDFTATAPAVPGSYSFAWQMVHEAVRWFGSMSASPHIAVGSVDGVCAQLTARRAQLAASLAETEAELAAVDRSDPKVGAHEAAALAGYLHKLINQLELVEQAQAANGCAVG